MPVALDHVNLRTQRLSVLRAFYVEVLGLQEGPRPPFGHPGAWLYAGAHPVVHLWQGTADDTASTPPGREPQLSHFAFTATDHAGFLARLRAAGVPHAEHPLPGRDVVQVKLHDPDGNALHVDFATTPGTKPAATTVPDAEDEASCGAELAAAADVPKAWASLMRHVVTNLERHATWVGTGSNEARREHEGLLAVAAGYQEMAAAAERAAAVMEAQRGLSVVPHDPERRDLARDHAWMKEKIALQRALAAMLEAHAEASARALAAWDAELSAR